jgi:hypothetical protein
MVKIAINRKIGGFQISIWGCLEILKAQGIDGVAYVLYIENDRMVCKRYDANTYNNESFLISTLDQGDSFDEDDFDYDYYYCSWGDNHDYRIDPILIDLAERFPDKIAYTPNSIKVVEIPDGVDWEINESDDGYEWIAEKSRKWY